MVIYHHKGKYSISEMCRFFDVSRSGYYGYVSRMDNPVKDLTLAEKRQECQEKCGKTYVYRRVHIWLERNGIHRNPKTILLVMQKYNLLSVVRKKYRNYGQQKHKYPNLLNRDFYTDKPNTKWVTDISYIKTAQETLYLSVIRDLYDNVLSENFFSVLKTEYIYTTKLKTNEEARLLIDEYIFFYNNQRIQLKTKNEVGLSINT